MHYYIDGYNLLFRLMYAHPDDLQKSRERVILDLDKKLALVKLDVSIVFDAAFQIGESSRSHFNNLEILFTAEGETADEFILDELKNTSSPQQETIVTSDKQLAWRARRCLAHTESVEAFMLHLNKSYKNKLRKLELPKKAAPLPAKSSPAPTHPEIKAEASQDYYARIFEASYEELVKQEKEKAPPKPPPKKQKRKKDPFAEPSLLIEAPTEMERWQKAFEERLKKQDTGN